MRHIRESLVRIEAKVDRFGERLDLLAEKVEVLDDRLDAAAQRVDALDASAKTIRRLSLAAIGAVAASVLGLVSSIVKSKLHL